MKNIHFVAAFAALAFFACSDDNEEDEPSMPGACYSDIRMYDDTDMEGSASCTEGITQSVTQADCDEAQEFLDTYYPQYQAVVTFIKSCPPKYKLKCKEKNGTFIAYNYYYGPGNYKSCEDM